MHARGCPHALQIEAKNGLENYCYSMRSTLADGKLADKLSSEDKDRATKAINDAVSWLEGNQLAEVEELEHKQKELEAICNPIISRAYQAAGPGAGMPGANGAGSNYSGPTVQEVD